MALKLCMHSCVLAGLLTMANIAQASAFAAEVAPVDSAKVTQQLSDTSGHAVKWTLRQPKETKISYKGRVSFDNAGMQSGTMLYPAPNAAGLLVAILTHAAISEASKESEKSKLQAEADKVLEPYRDMLDGLSDKAVMQAAIGMLDSRMSGRLIDFSENALEDWVVEVTPAFFLTQDERALILDNTIVLNPPSASGKDKSQHVVRVVSFPVSEKNPSAYWLANEGVKFKQESASLLAQSLLITLENAAASASEGDAFKTIRYHEGKSEKMERAQIVREQCGRMVIRNLRGIFISVPVTSPSGLLEEAVSCNR